jgi:hypothetical protein
MTELVSLAKRGVIKPLVSNRFKLNQATEALIDENIRICFLSANEQ